jgi:hypothetical protein
MDGSGREVTMKCQRELEFLERRQEGMQGDQNDDAQASQTNMLVDVVVQEIGDENMQEQKAMGVVVEKKSATIIAQKTTNVGKIKVGTFKRIPRGQDGGKKQITRVREKREGAMIWRLRNQSKRRKAS